jgi:NAD(P)H-dependent FMN reductase
MPALQAGGERFESAGVHFICYQKSMNNLPLNIKVIIGSVREGRFADKAATWIAGELAKESDVTVEVLDLNDYQMPFFNAPVSPSYKTEPYTHEAVARFTAKVAEGDAFVLVTPEYNHGTSGVLKNALDWVYSEWNHKAVGFVSYGSVGGARAVESLRLTAIELQMASTRNAVHFNGEQYFPALFGQTPVEELFATIGAKAAPAMIKELLWWGRVLKSARTNS